MLTRADVVGSDVDGAIEHGIAGEAEDEVDAAIVAEIRHFKAAIVTVTAQRDPGCRPMPADAPKEPPQMTDDLRPEGVLPGRNSTATDRPVIVS